MQEEKRRYLGIDLGKRTYALAFIFENHAVTFSNGNTSVKGRQELYKKILPTDRVAIEAGNLAFMMAKEMEAQVGCEVVVLNPGKLALYLRFYIKIKRQTKKIL